jgi:hypothetical protein
MTRIWLGIALVMQLAWVGGCGHGQPPAKPVVLFPKAVITREHVDEAMTFEAELTKRYNQPAPAGQPWFEVRPGTARVIVVAGHATAHARDGQIKSQDGGTGALAYMLNRLADCPAIISTYQSASDPNWYDDNDFKRALAELIDRHKPALVLDLHGSSSGRPYDVDFGTMHGGASLLGRDTLLVRLADGLRREGLVNLSQDFFPAARQATVTKWTAARGVPAVQLEISGVWLRPGGDDLAAHRYAQLLQALVRFVAATDSAAAR